LNFGLNDKIWAGIVVFLWIGVRVLVAMLHWAPAVPPVIQGFLTPEMSKEATAEFPSLLAAILILAWRKLSGRRKHVEGSPVPGKFAIYVAELEGDGRKGLHRTNIIRSLESELGKSAQILRASIELRLKESGNAVDDAALANRKAQRYLSKKKGDLMIWGQVINGPPKVIELRFASPVHDSSQQRRYSYNDKFELAADLGPGLGEILAALAVVYAIPVQRFGHFVAGVLLPTAEKLAGLVSSMPKSMRQQDRALLVYSYAKVEEVIGDQTGKNADLRKAIEAYRMLLGAWTREQFPLQWAGVQNNIGNILQTLGEQENELDLLILGVESFSAALEVWTQELSPFNWAMAQNNLGNSLARLGERENGSIRLQQAATSLTASLRVNSRENFPLQWAITMGNLGNVFQELGKREQSAALLKDAIRCHSVALEEISRERAPLHWASMQNNLGNSLMELGKLEGDPAHLGTAVVAYCNALKERSQERSPFDWAMTQFNLGNTYLQLGIFGGGTEKYSKAREAYQSSLTALTREANPLQWAMVQSNLGTTLEYLAGNDDPLLLNKSANAYSAALQVLTEEGTPRQHEIASRGRERVLQIIRQLQVGREPEG
jgi:tetratricopeptide (TPR) repeat protein